MHEFDLDTIFESVHSRKENIGPFFFSPTPFPFLPPDYLVFISRAACPWCCRWTTQKPLELLHVALTTMTMEASFG